MRPERTEADDRGVRQALIDLTRRNLEHYLKEEAETGSEPIMSVALRQRLEALESREPYVVTAFLLPRRFWPEGADLWTAYVLEPDDTLRVANYHDPEAA